MAYPRMDEMLWFGGRWWWFPGRQITQSRNSSGKTAGLTCWNPMAPPLREFCLWAKSRLSDALQCERLATGIRAKSLWRARNGETNERRTQPMRGGRTSSR